MRTAYLSKWDNKIKVKEIDNEWDKLTGDLTAQNLNEVLEKDKPELRGIGIKVTEKIRDKHTKGATDEHTTYTFLINPLISDLGNANPINKYLPLKKEFLSALIYSNELIISHSKFSETHNKRKYKLFGPVVDTKIKHRHSSITTKLEEDCKAKIKLINSEATVYPLYLKNLDNIMNFIDKYR